MFIRTLLAAVMAALTLHAAAAVDANSASRAELEALKGVGPGLSGKIVEARKSAPFKDWNDLLDRVGGIGPGNAARFSQGGLTVGGASFQAASAPPAAREGAKAVPAAPRNAVQPAKAAKVEPGKADKADKAAARP